MKKLNKMTPALIGIWSLVALAITLYPAHPALAQSVRGSLSGNVLDPSGAAIPGAKITVVDPNTGVTRETLSSAEGSYRLPELNLGSYDVTASAAGFSIQVQHGVQITIDNITSLDMTLRTGNVESVVNVDASAPGLETQSSEVGGTIQARQIVQLPLALGGVGALRSPEAFIFLLPGTTGPGSANSFNGIYTLKISGGQAFGNDDLLDGASQTRSENGSSFDEESPSVEALQEFKVITGVPAAEYGRTSGGIESFVTKGGSNQYHGSVFDIFRNEALDANTWFNNGNLAANCVGANDTPQCTNLYGRPDDKQNDYGVSLGGPATIPHLFNASNKVFFFFAWEQLKRTIGGTQVSTVPTVAERGGNFTDLYNPAAPPATGSTAINPCDGLPVYPGEVFDPATQRVVNGTPCRSAFAGNMVPAQRFSAVASNVLNYIPLPTTSGLFNNYFYQSSFPVNNTTYTIRVDINPSPRQKFFASYSTRDNLRTCCATPLLPYPEDSGTWQQNFDTHFGRAGWDFIFTPNLLNHFNFGYNRSNSANFAYPTLNNINYTQVLGISNAPLSKNFPGIDFDGRDQYRNLGNGLNNDWIDNGFRFNDSVSLAKGRNSISFGADFRIQQFSPLSYPTNSLIYARAQTSSDPANSELDGNSLASLLLGQVSSGNFGAGVLSTQPRWTSRYFALFAQDDLKVSEKLILNLGIRWDVDIPRTAAHSVTSNFSPNAIDPEYGIPGALVFGTQYKGNTRWADTYYKDVAPRVGFAFSPYGNGKTVFRGAGGIIYGPLQYADDGNGMIAGYKVQPVFTSGDGFSSSFLSDTGFPGYVQPPNLDPGIFNGQPLGDTYIERSFGKPPVLYEWSLQLQQQVAQDLILEIGYLGNKGQNLRSSVQNLNNIPLNALTLGNELNASVLGNTEGVPAPFSGFYSLWGAGAPIQRALRPFPQYSAIDSGCCLQNAGMSTYNALLVSLSRRFRSGLSLQASYTWEKNLTDADSAIPGNVTGWQVQNPLNLHQAKALSAEDLPQTFVVAPLYQLPFGGGKTYLNHGPASYVAGGWEVGAVLRYESGQPISFCCATSIPGWDNNIFYSRDPTQPLASAAYRAGRLNPFVAGENSYFNPAAFIDPNSTAVRGAGPYTFGNVPRVTGEVRAQNFYNEDVSIWKTTPIREGVSVVLKAEMLNVFNRHQFAVPDTNPTDSSFGVPTSTISLPRNVQFTARVSF
ncbi:TonB-dependent receptor [Acidisarcina polymorpha]|nr:TonB-dependent receptor [Acidisarcina polymorpha]